MLRISSLPAITIPLGMASMSSSRCYWTASQLTRMLTAQQSTDCKQVQEKSAQACWLSMHVCMGACSADLLVPLIVSACQQRPKLKLPRAHDVVASNLGRVWACLCTAWKHLHRISADVGLVTNTADCNAASALTAGHLHCNGNSGGAKKSAFWHLIRYKVRACQVLYLHRSLT